MESLAYLDLILVHDFPPETWQLIQNRQRLSVNFHLFFKGSKVTFISCLIFLFLFFPHFPAQANIQPGDRGENVTLIQQQLSQLGYFKEETTPPATTTFTDSYNANTYIYLGDKGEPVKLLQEALRKTGYYQGQITGVFDQATAEAVKKFQQANNINADGIVGAVTKAQILQKSGITNLTPTNLPQPTKVVKRGDSGDSVRWVQEKLKIAGFLKGNITGFFGASTEVAVKDFQKSRNLTVDGIVGVNTRNALARLSSQSSNPQSSGSSTMPTTLVKKGDSGSSVRWVQEKLKRAGYFNHEITGFFGVLTESGVKEFQKARKLTADGIVGEKTRNALNQSSTTTKNPSTVNTSQGILRKGDTGNQVKWLQEKLTQLGFYKGPITGVFGPLTETSVKNFQSAKRLTVDGIVGQKTQIAINDAISKL